MSPTAVPPVIDDHPPPNIEPAVAGEAVSGLLDGGTARATWRWMWSNPWYLLALVGGMGLPRLAPGTWGTLFAWASFAVLDPLMTDLHWAGLIAAGLYFGAWSAQHAGASLRDPDSRHIVIDEVIAFWFVLWLLPDDFGSALLLQACAFALFRLFDIAKPPPIRRLDARLKNGIGVMLDDLVAAFYALLVIAIAIRLFG